MKTPRRPARKIVERELEAIESTRGTLKASFVVQAARPANHPLHAAFDWDDTVAGQRWRLEQARGLIASVKLRVTTRSVKITSVAYVRDPGAKGSEQGYRSVKSLTGDPKMARAALLYELRRIVPLLERARDLASVWGIRDGIEVALAKVQASVEKLSGG